MPTVSEENRKEAARIAHMLKRASYGPLPGQVDQWLDGGGSRALRIQIGRDSGTPMPESGRDGLGVHANPGDCGPDLEYQWYPLARWWLQHMVEVEALLHEKMCLLWHSHFAVSQFKAEATAVVDQHRLIRKHALGNFREFCHEMTHDPAMLKWLDGAGSKGDSPNENYGREFMELFTLGPEPFEGSHPYRESDVRAAAIGLSGWQRSHDQSVCGGKWDSFFTPEDHSNEQVSMFGSTPRSMSSTDVVNAVCEQRATADFVANKVYFFLTGMQPGPKLRRRLADNFRNNGLEIRPLVRQVMATGGFKNRKYMRARLPVEWVTAMARSYGIETPLETAFYGTTDVLDALGQKLGDAPHVKGWPIHDGMMGGGAMASKAYYVQYRVGSSEFDPAIDAAHGQAEVEGARWVLERCGIYDPRPSTLRAVDEGLRQGNGRLGFRIAFLSPEFQMV